MMNRKVFTMLFGLLLAVGWTTGASAQKLAKLTRSEIPRHSVQTESETSRSPYVLEANGTMIAPQRAPQRTPNTITADEVRTEQWWSSKTYTWYNSYPASGAGQTAYFTTPATNPYQMMYMVKEIYTNPLYPGIQYDEVIQDATPYPGIEYGWGIDGNYQDITITLSGTYAFVEGIIVRDDQGNNVMVWIPNDDLPTGWTSSKTIEFYEMADDFYPAYMNGGGTITIPKRLFSQYPYVIVYVYAANVYPSAGSATISINGEVSTLSTDSWGTYGKLFESHIDDAPSYNGYTVMLVKVKDDAIDFPVFTSTGQDLIDGCFSKYESIEMLTDGMRVGSGNTAGTVFAYTGTLNRFFFISKGKTAQWNAHAPFYYMYEEFSPTTVDEGAEIKDFYEKMKQGATYNIQHDCQSVSQMEHYFSMSGKDGTTHNLVNSLVLYIPDDRSTSPDSEGYIYRDYDDQPTVGMYMIDLYTNVEASQTQTDYYTVTVDWHSNLDDLTHTDDIPQSYTLYAIWDEDKDGDLDTIPVYNGMDTVWHYDYPVGDPRYYDISYYVVGTPLGPNGTIQNPTYTNPDFFAKSNTDDVTIPGKHDVLGLQWQRYESDYVILNKAEQVNYYRNWLAPHALSVQGQAGYTSGNVGAAGRTLTLYRNDGNSETPIMDLDLIMDGNKAYYRIRYRSSTQQVEPGYDPQTGEMTTNNNNN